MVLVYSLLCGSCSAQYVGETGQHCCENKISMNWRRRKIKEAVSTNAINPTESMVQQGILNLEKGYEFDEIWSGFYLDIRNIVQIKIKFAR